MRIVSILLLAVVLNGSCQEIKTGVVESKGQGDKNLTDSDKTKHPQIDLKLISKNACGLTDFVFSRNNKTIGIGLGGEIGFAKGNAIPSGNNKPTETPFPTRKTPSPVCYSEDFGKSWQGENGLDFENLGSPQGITEINGKIFITGSRSPVWLNSENGWRGIYNPKNSKYSFENIEFAHNNENIGFVVSLSFSDTEHGSRIFKTQDGGKSWVKVYENIISGWPSDLLVVDKETAMVAMNDEYILRTEDGGNTWKPQELENTGRMIKEDDWIDLNDNGASDLTITSRGIVWVVGQKGSLYYSDDKGKTWKRPDKMPGSIGQQELHSIAFSPSGKGVAVGQNGYIIISEDEGKTWHEISQNVLKNNISESEVTKNLDKLTKVKFNDENAIVLGLQGIYELSFTR